MSNTNTPKQKPTTIDADAVILCQHVFLAYVMRKVSIRETMRLLKQIRGGPGRR